MHRVLQTAHQKKEFLVGQHLRSIFSPLTHRQELTTPQRISCSAKLLAFARGLVECLLAPPGFPDINAAATAKEAARSDVFDYIEMFYNSKRRHSSNGDLSPVEFERRYAQRWS